MPSLSDLRNAYHFQREAKKVRKELKSIHVEAEGRWSKVVITAEQEVVLIEIKDGAPAGELPGDLKDAMNRALKKAQIVSAEKMQPILGEMGMSGKGQ